MRFIVEEEQPPIKMVLARNCELCAFRHCWKLRRRIEQNRIEDYVRSEMKSIGIFM